MQRSLISEPHFTCELQLAGCKSVIARRRTLVRFLPLHDFRSAICTSRSESRF